MATRQTKRQAPSSAGGAVAALDGDPPVVALGCSAGGLEALSAFFAHVDPRGARAFVVVQHMAPDHVGSLVELLQRSTPLPVTEARDGQRIERDHVYVTPSRHELTVDADGHLRLGPRPGREGDPSSVDALFRSLAEHRGPRAVVVVLSGMGADGTEGARAVRARGGAVLVQAPETARFDSMPRSVVAAGLATAVAPAEELARRLDGHADDVDPEAHDAVLEVVRHLQRATGQDFALYKRSTLGRRIARRASVHQLDLAGYARYLAANPGEAELLFKELLIGVTSFYRDPDAWKFLEREVLPLLVLDAQRTGTLRAWVPACSTGEEAYSLAIAIHEALEVRNLTPQVHLQVFATDLDPAAIAKARRGVYPASVVADVPRDRLERYFVKENEEKSYRIKKEVRDAVVFAVHNAVQDPPFTKLDLVACRNLLIYLTTELQQRLLPRLHYALRPGGYLFLGSAEAIGGFGELFGAVASSERVYRALPVPGRTGLPVEASLPRSPRRAPPPPPDGEGGQSAVLRMQSLVEQLLVQRFAPAAVLVTAKGDVIYVNGRTDPFLEVPAGKANWNIFALARDGLRSALTSALPEALASRKRVDLERTKVEYEGRIVRVNVAVEPLVDSAPLRDCVLVTFTIDDGKRARAAVEARPAPRRGAGRAAQLELQLQQARDDLEALRRRMEGSDEDLKATNEELQATNEELQSANEELTTSKEEMQSMNEELQTLNSELHAKLEELSRAGNDMKNLLDSTEIAILFLDDALRVRRFTPPTTSLFKLIPGDVGRPLSDLATSLVYEELHDDARDVLARVASRERRVSTRDGRAYRVRIMPYRTSDNRVDGVVITFTSPTADVGAPVAAGAP